MRLFDFMRLSAINDAAMAEKIGLSKSGLRKIKYGERVPSLGIAVAIERATDGAVRPADLLPGDQPRQTIACMDAA